MFRYWDFIVTPAVYPRLMVSRALGLIHIVSIPKAVAIIHIVSTSVMRQFPSKYKARKWS